MRSDGARINGPARPPGEMLGEAERARFADLLVAVARTQDRAAYSELFGYYAPRVKSYLMRLGADNAQAEEIAQDVMVTVWRKAALFDRAQASVSTLDFPHRAQSSHRCFQAHEETRSGSGRNDDPALRRRCAGCGVEAMETETRVRAAMKDLPEEQLLLLRLAFYEGCRIARSPKSWMCRWAP